MAMRSFLALAAISILSIPVAAQDADSVAAYVVEPGDYRDLSDFETFHGLRINEDGTFEWAAAAGAMNRRSNGSWEAHDGYIELTTTPTPVPPEFVRSDDDRSEGAPFLMVRLPGGRGLFGIDFTLVCGDGKHISHYTQEEGWDLVPGECGDPQTLTLEDGINDVGPEYFDIRGYDGTYGLTFTLVPNDIGVIDLTGTRIMPSADGLTMVWMENPIEMVRVVPGE